MKTNTSQILVALAAAVSFLPAARAATITYDPAHSQSLANGGADFSASGYGSAGYLFDATAPVGSAGGGGQNYTGVNPLDFSATQATSSGSVTYSTISQFSGGITASNVGGDHVNAAGVTYGTPPDGMFSYIGLGGIQGTAGTTAGVSGDSFTINFSLASTTGYRIAIFTEGEMSNTAGVDGVTLTSCTSSATNASVFDGVLVGYSYDVTNIAAGDSVTVHLSDPQYSGNLDVYGFTADALPAGSIPEPSTFVLGGLGFAALWVARWRVGRAGHGLRQATA